MTDALTFSDAIETLREPRPTAEQVDANPALDDCRRVPYFLIVAARKPGHSWPAR